MKLKANRDDLTSTHEGTTNCSITFLFVLHQVDMFNSKAKRFDLFPFLFLFVLSLKGREASSSLCCVSVVDSASLTQLPLQMAVPLVSTVAGSQFISIAVRAFVTISLHCRLTNAKQKTTDKRQTKTEAAATSAVSETKWTANSKAGRTV